MYRSFLSSVALASALWLHAQQQVHQVFILSEGYYDYFNGGGQLVPVTLGSYDPVSGTYQTVATLTGPRFGSDVILDGTSVFVAADDRIVRFDADSYAETGMVLVQGVRKLAVWGDDLLITRGSSAVWTTTSRYVTRPRSTFLVHRPRGWAYDECGGCGGGGGHGVPRREQRLRLGEPRGSSWHGGLARADLYQRDRPGRERTKPGEALRSGRCAAHVQ